MSALIKQGSAHVTRALASADEPVDMPIVVEAVRDPELIRLEKKVAQLTEALAAAKRAEAVARDSGHAAGLAEAADRVDLVRETLVDAMARFEAKLDLLDGLAPLLARAALEKLFTPADDWAAMTAAAIGRQLAALRERAAVTLRVSPKDFDSDAVAALGGARCNAVLDPELRAGTARIGCGLDRIDLDLRAQWAELSALLDTMAGEAA